jgi:CoA-transferase family III
MIAAAGSDDAEDWARSGVLALTGRSDGPPLVPPGHAATLANEVGDRLAAVTGESQPAGRVDGAALLGERAAFLGLSRHGQIAAGGAARLLPTADGWAAVSYARPDDHQLLAALVGSNLPPDPWPCLTAWLRTHPGADLAERAALLGLPAAPVQPAPRPTRSAVGPTVPAPRRLRSPAGLLVVDFSALWAGPLCAHLLGLGGARVVKVETPQRLDGARRGNCDFYDLLHAGHRSVVLDPSTTRGRQAMSELAAAADIVIEASRPRALAGFGIDAAAVVEQGAVWVSITAAGRQSPRVGFGDDVAASAGLVAYDAAGPVFCGDALADPLTGLVAAELALSEPTDGHGILLDVAMSEVIAATLNRPGQADGPAPRTQRSARGWVLDTPSGPVPVSAPRTRMPAGRAPEPGVDTDQVLRELGIFRS